MDPAAEAARRLEADPSMLLCGPLSVLHAVLDVVVRAYGEAAETVRAALDRLEDRVLAALACRPHRGHPLPGARGP
ncbi:hypothetical protein [Streptomyces sp. NBC_01367]|uniref:hypothetical protein n=1 Tax=Streptomyces sp. NBC_01367 TaxID=2903841 RepID=UPI003245B66A